MPSTSTPISRKERGAALVEAALVTPLLVMLLLGTVTSAMAYSQKTSLENAAREASRYGATLPVNGDINSWLNSVLTEAAAAANLDLAPSVPGQQICVAYVYPKGVAVNDRNTRIIQQSGAKVPATGGICFDDGRPDDERRVQVVTQRSATIQALVFSMDLTLSAPSAARFERGN